MPSPEEWEHVRRRLWSLAVRRVPEHHREDDVQWAMLAIAKQTMQGVLRWPIPRLVLVRKLVDAYRYRVRHDVRALTTSGSCHASDPALPEYDAAERLFRVYREEGGWTKGFAAALAAELPDDRPPKERIAAWLQRNGEHTATHAQIAAELGLARETVTRKMKELRE
jgi:hypothetical protein